MVAPTYYKDFQCIGGACRHNCCIGWEIDIDEETLCRYKAISGETGECLRQKIVGDPPHFLLDSEERCPFLTGENLCGLLLTLGEDALCQICRDHPRYRNFWPGRTEIGLGASCEEAARLILSQRVPLALMQDGSVITDTDARKLYALRVKLLERAYDSLRTLDEAESEILRLADASLPEQQIRGWIPFYEGLERLDARWTAILREGMEYRTENGGMAFERYMGARQMEYRHMLAYFLYRHVPEALDDGNVATKVALAVLSCRILRFLAEVRYEKNHTFSFADQTELFRMYSAEIEYSEENLAALYDLLWQ